MYIVMKFVGNMFFYDKFVENFIQIWCFEMFFCVKILYLLFIYFFYYDIFIYLFFYYEVKLVVFVF